MTDLLLSPDVMGELSHRLSRIAHDLCRGVPHDIGLKLGEAVLPFLARRADEARREGVAEGLARALELIRQEQDKPMLTPTSDLLERIARRLVLDPKSVDVLIERMQSDDLVDADGVALPPTENPHE